MKKRSVFPLGALSVLCLLAIVGIFAILIKNVDKKQEKAENLIGGNSLYTEATPPRDRAARLRR